jgi:CubicO group peptidase (beta-lactamase class C family)
VYIILEEKVHIDQRWFLLIPVVLLLLVGCSSAGEEIITQTITISPTIELSITPSPTLTHTPDPTITELSEPTKTSTPTPESNGLRRSAPEEQGMDPVLLEALLAYIDDEMIPIDGIVIVRSGAIVLETYLNPEYNQNIKHNLYSVTKSITSALIGIAIQEGYIDGIDDRVVDFFTDWEIENLDERKMDMTIEDLLTMQCGFEWEGPDIPGHTWWSAVKSGNPIKYTLNRPMSSEPGSEWYYNGGCSHLLSAILTQVSGMTTLEFGRQYLFEPLGVTQVFWPRDPYGFYYGGQDIHLRPMDMAKIGQLFLDRGVWGDEQIVPAEWVEESTLTHIRLDNFIGYGYQWWTIPRHGVFYASGWKGQSIFVIPDMDMVVVFTASLGDYDPDPGIELLLDFIIPAVDG